MKKISIIISFIFVSQSVLSQNTFNIKDRTNLLVSRVGVEPTLILSLGYLKCFHINQLKRNISCFGEATSPIEIFGSKNYELKTGCIMEVIKVNDFGISYQQNFSTGHVETKNFHSQKFAWGQKILVGYFNDNYYCAFISEYEKIFANKIKHTQYYREFIYEEAKDGWYNGAGGNFQLGIETGITIKQRTDIILELKIPRSEKFNSYNGSPAHINLLLTFRI